MPEDGRVGDAPKRSSVPAKEARGGSVLGQVRGEACVCIGVWAGTVIRKCYCLDSHPQRRFHTPGPRQCVGQVRVGAGPQARGRGAAARAEDHRQHIRQEEGGVMGCNVRPQGQEN